MLFQISLVSVTPSYLPSSEYSGIYASRPRTAATWLTTLSLFSFLNSGTGGRSSDSIK